MRYLIGLLLALLPLGLSAVEFKVASYNVENLFDDKIDGTEYKEYRVGRHNWSTHMVDIKLNHISEVLCEVDADIVALQEIENVAILQRLQKRLKRVGCPYRYRAITSKKKSVAVNVALLSRYSIKKKREIAINYSKHDRNILEVKLDIDGYPFTLFVNHWKAKSRNGTESRRVHYAKALLQRLKKLPKRVEYIIVGDTNSNYDEYRLLTKKNNDTNGITAINHILQTIKNGRLITKEDISKLDALYHYNLWLEYPPYKRWSHNYYGHKGAIDHILIPHQLVDGENIDYINHSFGVSKVPILFTTKGWINRWQYKHGKHLGKGYSDHLPIFASFSTKAYQKDTKQIPKDSTIEALYRVEKITQPIKLSHATLLFKRGDNGVIKQSKDGAAIYLYGSARGLEEGKIYDIVVEQIADYKGLKEITKLNAVKRGVNEELQSYYRTQESLSMNKTRDQNQIFVNLRAIYKKGRVVIDGKQIPIYFIKRAYRPTDGSRLTIDYAQLGYHDGLQLIIHSDKDFSIER